MNARTVQAVAGTSILAAFAFGASSFAADAQPSETAALTAVVHDVQTATNEALLAPSTRSGRHLPDGVTPGFASQHEALIKGVSRTRDSLHADGLDFVSVSVTVGKPSVSIQGDTAVLEYDETDTYRTAETVRSGDDLTATAEVTRRRATFTRVDGEWKLSSLVVADDQVLATPLNDPRGTAARPLLEDVKASPLLVAPKVQEPTFATSLIGADTGGV